MLTDAPPFPEAERRDAAAVRRYRAALATRDRAGFGPGLLAGEARAFLIEDGLPLGVLETPGARIEVTTFAPEGRSGAVQVIRVAARGGPYRPAIGLTGTIRLGRAAYAQLTEGGPLLPPVSSPRASSEGSLMVMDDPALGAAAALLLPEPVEVPP
ncbi:MAG: hypothetical protein ACRDF0_11615, partial [Candidatus Limnocylindria bacterium]